MVDLLPSPSEPTVYVVATLPAAGGMIEVLPEWARLFGRKAAVVPVAAPGETDREGYHRLVEFLRDEYHAIGALMLSGAAALFEHGGHLFDELDSDAELLGEVGVAVRSPGRLSGLAPAVDAARRAFDSVIDGAADASEVLVIGTNGNARAIALALSGGNDETPTRRITLTAFDGKSMSDMRRRIARLPERNRPTLRHIESRLEHDRVITLLPPGSAVINTIEPGDTESPSPFSPAALFPERGLVWDLAATGGKSAFLDGARRQRRSRRLRFADGALFQQYQWLGAATAVFGAAPAPVDDGKLLRLLRRASGT